MKKVIVTVTEAARNFADCVNRAHYQDTTFILLKNGKPFARLGPEKEKYCTGKDLAEVLAEAGLSDDESRAWYRDLQEARDTLQVPGEKWQ